MSHRIPAGTLVPDELAAGMAQATRLLVGQVEQRLPDLPAGPERATVERRLHRFRRLLIDLEAAAAAHRTSGGGSPVAETAETPPSSASPDDRIGAEEAASMIGITRERVGQLARAGALPGRKVAGAWTFRRGDVHTYISDDEEA